MTAQRHAWQLTGRSPMERTLAWLRDHGWVACVVERWLERRGVRVDCFGCDVLAAKPGDGILLVQVCGHDFAAHLRKLESNGDAALFVRSGGDVQLIGWRRLEGYGWVPRIWSWREGGERALDEVLAGVEWQPVLPCTRSGGSARPAGWAACSAPSAGRTWSRG